MAKAGDPGALGYSLLMAVIARDGLPAMVALSTEAIATSLEAGDRDTATLARFSRAPGACT